MWVFRGSESRSGFDLGTGAIFVGGGDDNFGDGLSEPKGVEVVKDKVLRAIREVLDVKEILHGMPDESVKMVIGCFDGSQGAEHGNGAKGKVILLLSEVGVEGKGIGWIKDDGGPKLVQAGSLGRRSGGFWAGSDMVSNVVKA